MKQLETIAQSEFFQKKGSPYLAVDFEKQFSSEKLFNQSSNLFRPEYSERFFRVPIT